MSEHQLIKTELLLAVDEERAEAIIEHRRKLKCPLTVRAAKMLATQLLGDKDPNGAADEMLLRGWKGYKPSWRKESQDTRGGYSASDHAQAARERIAETRRMLEAKGW